MKKRIRFICSRLFPVEVFADIGCDHGYCTQYMLENDLCKRAYISDVSRESLRKAETLLAEDIGRGRCFPVCADGLEGLPEPCDLALIAGMGGEEIIHVLGGELPAAMLLQPMKNTPKLRAFLIERGCRIELDETFEDGKFYDLILARREGGTRYTEWELFFGRDNLLRPSPAFRRKVGEEYAKTRARLFRTKDETQRAALQKTLAMYEEVNNAVIEDL